MEPEPLLEIGGIVCFLTARSVSEKRLIFYGVLVANLILLSHEQDVSPLED